MVGGGPAGIGAALGAAEAGAGVILAERYGFLGGNATAALVMPLMSFHTQRTAFEQPGATKLFPTDHGPGEPVVAGALARLLEPAGRDRRRDRARRSRPATRCRSTPSSSSSPRSRCSTRPGSQFLFHAFASGVVDDGPLRGVVFETKSGPLVVRRGWWSTAPATATSRRAPARDYEIGRKEDGLVQPMTLMFRMVAVRAGAAFAAYVREHPDQWRGVHGLWDLIRAGERGGRARAAARGHPVLRHAARARGQRQQHAGHPGARDRRVRLEPRRAREPPPDAPDRGFLRRRVPGFEHAYVAQSGVHTGVRETRRIVGDYRLTAEDVLAARKFDDVVARGSYPVDIHNPKGSGTVLKRLPDGEAYDIPLRCLLPRGIENLLVAGRCLSGSHEAHSSYRVMPIVMATGPGGGRRGRAGGAPRA